MISPTHTISPEWQNENAIRAYPLEDDAPAAAVLPTWLISDLRISCPTTYAKVYVSSAYVSDTLVSVAISGLTESGTTVGLLARTVTRDELEPHRAYSMDRLSNDASGTIAFGEVPAGAQPFRLAFRARRVAEEVAPGIEVVDYLESTGTQWISIGMTFDETFKMEIDFKYDTISAGATCHGQNGASNSLYPRFTFGKGAAGWNDWYCGLGDLNYRTNIPLDTQRHTFVVDAINKEFKIDDSTYTVDYTRFTHLHNPYSASLFCRTTIDTGSQDPLKIIGRIFACKIWRSGVIVRDFIPVRFTNGLGQSEGAIFDRFSGQLFRNQGTGVFGMGDPHVRYEVDAPIVEAAITRVRAPGVTRIVDRAHGTSATGIIDLSGNSEFRTAVDPSDPHTIVFTLTDTYREIATSVCDATPSKDACGDTPVRTINGVAPTTEETEIGGVTYPAGTILLRFR